MLGFVTQKERMLAGQLYTADDPELQAELLNNQLWLTRYNQSHPKERDRLLREHLGSVGENVNLRAPFYCDYGYNIELGAGVFLNFNCVILDVVKVSIGAGTQIGPAVQIYTATHPLDPEQRRQGLEFGKPVTIGRNVWIGGGAILNPGVTIGDDAVIGSGSVVTRDVAPGVTVMGNPARPGGRIA
ncbi:MAG: sugar O-acetyltransferase [Candidatus Eremiobacteraeota bacterium]|nr:sugar O-acetyltransferase [Candidatus Eremiobacteraeota bacterium]